MIINENKLRRIIKKILIEGIAWKGGIENSYNSSSNSDDSDNFSGPDNLDNGSISGSNSLNDLDPVAKKSLTSFVEDLKSKGFEVIITSTYRSIGKQKSIKFGSNKDVAAKPGYSPHNFGLAIDINIKYTQGGKTYHLKLASSKSEWEKVVGKNGPVPYEKYNLRWGGTFKNYDPVHFDVYPQIKNPSTGKKGVDDPSGLANYLRNKAGENVDKKYSDIV